jgi:hypothetical protein
MSEATLNQDAKSDAPPVPSVAPRGLSRWVAPIALVVALAACGVAAWALLGPPPNTSVAPTAQQIAAAKSRVCGAYQTVRAAVQLQTHAEAGTDPVALQAVAANARLSMAYGATYLLGTLDPATPPQLAAAVRTFASDLQDIAMNALAGAGNDDPAQLARVHDAEAVSAQVGDACK